MSAELTAEHIEAVLTSLPIQGRIMIHLLMLQYLDVPQEEIEYIAADRPDPRLQAGAKPLVQVVSREAVESIAARITQYRTIVRQRRERLWLQGECLRRQMARTEALCKLAEDLLTRRFGLTQDAVRDLKAGARAAIAKPMIRQLETRWEQHEIDEEEYRRRRLSIEYQTLLRRLDRERKRLEVSVRELETASLMPLQDHEIATVWGIPNSTLAARKVKYLQQYLEGLQAKVHAEPQRNLWRETFLALSRRPVERSVAAYDGLEFTEEALIEKLRVFASGGMTEELESKSWPIVARSLFALQRLAAIQNEMDLSLDVLEQELLQRIAPAPRDLPAIEEPKPAGELELDAMGEHVLRSMLGEDRRM